MLKRIVVGTDGSRTASFALDHAITLAKAVGAEVVVMSSYRDRGGGMVEGSAVELCRNVLDEVKERYASPGIALRTVLRKGQPADALIELAEEEDADLIVVGNVGMSKGRRLTLGSVPDAVSHHATCHVLIVHTTDD